MTAPLEILELNQRFGRNLPSYRQGLYNEAQVRIEYIDPFFQALGWDMANRSGYAEAYKDVIHEDAIKVGGGTRAPDYCFRIGGTRKFFVEAKKPSVDIGVAIDPAFQLRRYAWSARLPLSILTDFEELAVYDCRVKPDKNDKSSTARVLYLTYDQYPQGWDEIASVFARESVLRGAFDRYAGSMTAMRGTAALDTAFLAEIERWREMLAGNIALRNPALSQRDLNWAVQQTIDRIIFLRICEDRGIEPYGTLLGLVNGAAIYDRMAVHYRHADSRFNSGLFHFDVERGRPEAPDGLTLGMVVDDKPLREILHGLYYPDSAYEFSVLGADILGQVYEQFLGKVIRLTPGHRAVVEEKPEVRKAGGVYYTPTYIVDYIVRQTIDTLLEGKRPGPLGGVSKLRILDPACGSGSFLLGAYQRLLDWHRDQYVADGAERWATGRAPRIYQHGPDDWRLTVDERKRILLNNIYGVDIDPQAVEVTKLSLLLKVLEGESDETLGQQMKLFAERALPDLTRNIKCGNSLLGPDFYDGRQMELLGEAELLRINPFDWSKEFQEIMADGGFDAVIGNPPYIRIQALKEWVPVEVEYYKQRYRSAGKGNYDIYVVFVEKGLGLLNERGRLGYILPHKFFNAQYGAPLRALLSQGKHLSSVVHFADQQVFAGATTYTCLMFLEKAGASDCRIEKVTDLASWRARQASENASLVKGARSGGAQEANATVSSRLIPAASVTDGDWNFSVGPASALFDRLHTMQFKLGDLAHTFVGTQTSADDVFVLDACREEGQYIAGRSHTLGGEVRVERAIVRPYLRGQQIRRYAPPNTDARLICPYAIASDSCRLLAASEMRSDFPLTWEYLLANKSALAAREKGKFAGLNWHAFGYPKSMTLFQLAKIIVPDYHNAAAYSMDTGQRFFKTGYGILALPGSTSALYLLGLLNSSLLFRYLLSIGTFLRGGYVRFWSQYIEQLPIRTIDFADSGDRARHDRLVDLVGVMLDLHKRLASENLAHVKTALERQIEATDRQIDLLVYELYGLTDAEIRTVEESG